MNVLKITVDKIPKNCSDCSFYKNCDCIINIALGIDECILETKDIEKTEEIS